MSNLVRTLVRDKVRSPAQSLIPAIERFFTTLVSANSKHYTIPTVTLTGDFEIEADISTTSTSLQSVISGGVAAGDLEIHTTAAGVAIVVIAGATVITGTIAVNDSKLNDVKVTRVGSTVTLFVNDVSDGTASNSATLTVDSIGQRTGGTLFFDGIIANVLIKDAGVITRNYRIDQDWVGPNTILVDSSGNNQNGAAVNITDSDALNYVFDSSVSPNTWTDVDTGLIVIEVAGT